MLKTNKIPTKTVTLVGLNINSKKTFFNFLKKHVFEFVIHNKASFIAKGIKNQYIHESAQQRQNREAQGKLTGKKIVQNPLHIISSVNNNNFTLKAYTQTGIECLNLWLTLLHQSKTLNLSEIDIITSQKTHLIEEIVNKNENTTYSSTNYIPYRHCVLEDGFYYDVSKKYKVLTNFEERLKKNIFTFLKSTCGINDFDEQSLWLCITNIKALGKKIALNKQKKEFFKLSFSCNYTLPSSFSLGQNVAYGNGVFIKQEKTPDYELQKNNLKTNT